MRISDWSSDVCSSDLGARRSLYRRALRSDPAVLVAAPHRHRRRRRDRIRDGRAHSVGLLERPWILWIGRRLAIAGVYHQGASHELGRASRRERVCQYVSIWGVAVYLKKKN